ncbi:MAG: hypothetical protein HC912_04130 [Saprospiraceae bacterium]|nr:hypothetical protein [Saprospiraceae bacterium]
MVNSNYQAKIPIIRINTNSAIIYEVSTISSSRSIRQKANEKNLTRGKFNGYMSNKAKQKIKKILSTWIIGTKLIREQHKRDRLPKLPYLTFITLTLSSKQKHSDHFIRRHMLNAFIQKLERKHNVWHHFYVCEKQKNGNIHFHLLIDSFVSWQVIRGHWNSIQAIHGYIAPFKKLYGHSNPNSTDIHALYEKKDVAAYVIKYVTKENDSLKIKGRIWGCSDALRKLVPYEKIIEGELWKVATNLCNEDYFEVQRNEQFTLIIGPVMRFIEKYHSLLHQEINTFLREQVKTIYKLHPEIIRKMGEQANQKEIIKATELENKKTYNMSISLKFKVEQLGLSLKMFAMFNFF